MKKKTRKGYTKHKGENGRQPSRATLTVSPMALYLYQI